MISNNKEITIKKSNNKIRQKTNQRKLKGKINKQKWVRALILLLCSSLTLGNASLI
jgi:hypothetical protein